MNNLHERKRILVVEDEPVTLAMATGILEQEYEVLAGACDGEEGLRLAQAELPDLILTDIVMPRMGGFELCGALKEDESTRHIPVVFLSGAITMDDFLSGHDVGGEDFLVKPFDSAGLRHIVSLTLRNIGERQHLAEDAKSAFSTAMVAMSSAAEMGVVLNFIRASYACADYGQLADALVSACGEYGLSACVRLHGRMGDLTRNRMGNTSTLEQSILRRLVDFGRIVDFSRRIAINYEHVTLMVTDMPREDVERCGRLRDYLAILAESADARLRAIDDSLEIDSKHRALADLVSQTQSALTDIDRRHRDNKNDTRVIMYTMLATVEQSFAQLGMTTAQEDYLTSILREAVDQVLDLFDQGLAIDDHLSAVKDRLAQG